ncbi:YbhN family protein [Candidatus Uabimicrobium sp. HlEnr_7]|uniref:lysylphosphatidylglycerol synthase transmembrane domain-containing protein n=1 Tax=Candidatus Uabimicrobium helgolandensis TaxID=3095367 RepID=UPI00355683FC
MKKRLGFLLRLSITFLIIFYIINYMIVFDDIVYLDNGKSVRGNISHITSSTCFINIHGNKQQIPFAQIDLTKGIEYGFYSVVSNLDLTIYFLFCLFLFCNILLTSWRILLILKPQNITLSYWQMTKINFISTFFGNFLPGFTGGDALKIYYLAKKSSLVLKPLALVLFDRVIGLMALILVATTVTIFQIHTPVVKSFAPFIFTLFGGVVFGCLVLFFLPLQFLQRKHSLLDQIIEIIFVFRQKPIVFFQAAAISILVHCSTNISVYGFAQALHIDLPIYIFFVFVPISFIVMMLPISLAGWGVGEATYSYLFSYVGIAKTKAVTLSVLTKFGQMLVGIIGAMIWIVDKDIRHKKD